MAEVVLEGVSKVYDDGTVAVDDVDLTIDAGEFFVLVGPSGCGKTTTLRMVAGLEEITEGELRIGEDVVTDRPARRRDIAMVFQNYSLYPHMTVAQNIGFGLRMHRTPKVEIRERVEVVASILGLTDHLGRKPRQLSGGQRQRVAMGRAIARNPAVFLMDEPLSNLDAQLRVQMRTEISNLQRETGVTTLYVTHDQVEAMTMGDRVGVMRRAELQQVGPPQSLYDDPDNVFVAGFLGSPSMNLLTASIRRSDDGRSLHVQAGNHELHLGPEVLARRPALAGLDGGQVIVGVRPEHLQVGGTNGSPRPGSTIDVVITIVESLGSVVNLHADLDAPAVDTEDVRELLADREDASVEDVDLSAGRAKLVVQAPGGTPVREGQRINLAIDAERLHFFDPATGAAIRG